MVVYLEYEKVEKLVDSTAIKMVENLAVQKVKQKVVVTVGSWALM
jgi:hypothetical protein